jgi:HK97 family phage prohead protease
MREIEMITRAGDFALKSVDVAKREVVGTITTNALDRYHEVVEPGGAVLENYRKNPVVLLNHNSFDLPIGKNLWIKPEGSGLLALTKFASTMQGDDVLALYEQGIMKAWSIGFKPLKWEDATQSEEAYSRKYTEWELLEYSAVTIPANPEAVTNALAIAHTPEIRKVLESEMEAYRLRDEIHGLVLQAEELPKVKESIENLAKQLQEMEIKLNVLLTFSEPDTIIETVKENRPGMSAKEASDLIARTVVETLGAYGVRVK